MTLWRALLISLLVLRMWPAHAELATERYAPAQLRVAQHFLESARAAAARADFALAGRLAWQASFDARLAWGMTESPHLRSEAAEVVGAASALVERITAR